MKIPLSRLCGCHSWRMGLLSSAIMPLCMVSAANHQRRQHGLEQLLRPGNCHPGGHPQAPPHPLLTTPLLAWQHVTPVADGRTELPEGIWHARRPLQHSKRVGSARRRISPNSGGGGGATGANPARRVPRGIIGEQPRSAGMSEGEAADSNPAGCRSHERFGKRS